MAATDYELLLYQRLKAILLAHAPLVDMIPGLGWVWYDGNHPDPENVTTKVETSYPRIALEPGGNTEEGLDVRPRYGDHNVNATPASLARNVSASYVFTVRITHRTLKLTANTPVEAEVRRALRGSNQTLSIPGSPQTAGYSWVKSWTLQPLTRTMGLVEGDTSGQARMQSVIPVLVTTLVNSADLLT